MENIINKNLQNILARTKFLDLVKVIGDTYTYEFITSLNEKVLLCAGEDKKNIHFCLSTKTRSFEFEFPCSLLFNIQGNYMGISPEREDFLLNGIKVLFNLNGYSLEKDHALKVYKLK